MLPPRTAATAAGGRAGQGRAEGWGARGAHRTRQEAGNQGPGGQKALGPGSPGGHQRSEGARQETRIRGKGQWTGIRGKGQWREATRQGPVEIDRRTHATLEYNTARNHWWATEDTNVLF